MQKSKIQYIEINGRKKSRISFNDKFSECIKTPKKLLKVQKYFGMPNKTLISDLHGK